MAHPARHTRFLSVAFDGSYGIRRIRVYACVDDPEAGTPCRESSWHTARETGAFRGEVLEDLVISAYAGRDRPADDEEQGIVWGWRHGFEPSAIQDPEQALRIAATLKAIDKALEKLAYGPGGPGAPISFADYLRRMAAILRCCSIRIYQPTPNGRSFLGAALPLTTGPDLVETIGQAWAGGERVEDICRRLSAPAPEEGVA